MRLCHSILAFALVACVAACAPRHQSDQSASPAPADSLQSTPDGATPAGELGGSVAPSPAASVAAESTPANGLHNRYVIKVPATPNLGSVIFTVGINGEAPTAFSAPDSQGDITEALHPGRNDLVVGWETDASSNNIADLRIGEQNPDGHWNTVFSLEVGTNGYGHFPSKGTRKYSIYAR